MKEDGTLDLRSNVLTITKLLMPYNLKLNNTYQDIPDLITMYPKDFFCPKDHQTREINLTENTHCIHHFNGSWWPKGDRFTAYLREKGLNRRVARLISKSIFFPTHVFQHLFNGTFFSQVKRHLNQK